MMTLDKPKRLYDIDKAKGLAIMLVVLGHVVARKPPEDNLWFVLLKQSIYSFHMAFFMFLSGVVFFKSQKPLLSISDYKYQIAKRFKRLMPAYFLFCFVVLVGKYISQFYLHVDNPVSGFNDIVDVVLFPMESVASFLWYIYVLFMISVFCLTVNWLSNKHLVWLLMIALVLTFVPGPIFLGLNQFNKYLLFFVLGGCAITYWRQYLTVVDKYWLLALVLLLSVLVLFHDDIRHESLFWLLPAVLSIPSLHGLCRIEGPHSGLLTFVGTMSFVIYLMNTITIGIIKGFLLKFVSWDGLNFIFLFFPVLLISGIALPIVVKRYVFHKIPWLDRITT